MARNKYDIDELEQKISALMADEDVTSKKGVYEYVLSNCTRAKVLSVRAFSDKDKRTKYEQQMVFALFVVITLRLRKCKATTL